MNQFHTFSAENVLRFQAIIFQMIHIPCLPLIELWILFLFNCLSIRLQIWDRSNRGCWGAANLQHTFGVGRTGGWCSAEPSNKLAKCWICGLGNLELVGFGADLIDWWWWLFFIRDCENANLLAERMDSPCLVFRHWVLKFVRIQHNEEELSERSFKLCESYNLDKTHNYWKEIISLDKLCIGFRKCYQELSRNWQLNAYTDVH